MCFSETTCSMTMGSSKSKTTLSKSSEKRNSLKRTRPRKNHAYRDKKVSESIRTRLISEKEAIVLRECRVVLERINVSSYSINNNSGEKSKSHKTLSITDKREKKPFEINLTQPARTSPRNLNIRHTNDRVVKTGESPSSVIVDHGHGHFEYITATKSINFRECSVRVNRCDEVDRRSVELWRSIKLATLSSSSSSAPASSSSVVVSPPVTTTTNRKIHILKKNRQQQLCSRNLPSVGLKRLNGQSVTVNISAYQRQLRFFRARKARLAELFMRKPASPKASLLASPKLPHEMALLDKDIDLLWPARKSGLSGSRNTEVACCCGTPLSLELTTSKNNTLSSSAVEEKQIQVWDPNPFNLHGSVIEDDIAVDFIKKHILVESLSQKTDNDWESKMDSVMSSCTVDHNFGRADCLRGLELKPIADDVMVALDDAFKDIMEVIKADTDVETTDDNCLSGCICNFPSSDGEFQPLEFTDLDHWVPVTESELIVPCPMNETPGVQDLEVFATRAALTDENRNNMDKK